MPAPATQEYDRSTALVVVDVQRDFAEPGGALAVDGGEEVVAPINAEVVAAVSAGALVVATQDWHPPRTPHFATDGGPWPVHCVAGTPGAELHPGLLLPGGAPRVRKGTGSEDGYSGFSEHDLSAGGPGSRQPTVLGGLLERAGVRRLVVVGLAGDYCVRATAIDGAALGLEVVVPLALTRFVVLAPGDEDRAVADLRAAGVRVV